jgi:hypothetical protein
MPSRSQHAQSRSLQAKPLLRRPSGSSAPRTPPRIAVRMSLPSYPAKNPSIATGEATASMRGSAALGDQESVTLGRSAASTFRRPTATSSGNPWHFGESTALSGRLDSPASIRRSMGSGWARLRGTASSDASYSSSGCLPEHSRTSSSRSLNVMASLIQIDDQA